MKKIVLFSFLLVLGLCISQLRFLIPESLQFTVEVIVKHATLVFLSFIMIHVGLEFSLDRSRLRSYGWDYFVAFTAATFPWIFCAGYFVYCLPNATSSSLHVWIDALLLARFASPTSAGVLFAMMAAAGLEDTWVFKKARILAIFDDLDTIILLIPIKMLIIGFSWESIVLLFVIGALLYSAWRWLHSVSLPIQWPWVMLYSLIITGICEGIYIFTNSLEEIAPIQIEVLLPSFVMGCVLMYPKWVHCIHEFLNHPSEKTMKLWISALFIFLVGASMPYMGIFSESTSLGNMSVPMMLFHISMITLLSNLGKMFPLFCYRNEATWKERFALSLGLCPRGEVGAGVIIVALGLLSYTDKSLIMIAMFSLALNLILTGPLIALIKKLLIRRVSAG